MNNKSNFDLLQDAHLDNLISLAYKQNEDEEIQSILDEADQRQLSEEDEALSKQIYAHFLEKVEAEKRDEKRKNRAARWSKSMMRFVEVAACLVPAIATSFFLQTCPRKRESPSLKAYKE